MYDLLIKRFQLIDSEVRQILEAVAMNSVESYSSIETGNSLFNGNSGIIFLIAIISGIKEKQSGYG